MELLQKDEELFLEADEWINKSIGRGSLKLKGRDEAGEEREVADWPFVMFPGMPYVRLFPPHLFPWANIRADDEFAPRITKRRSMMPNVAFGIARTDADTSCIPRTSTSGGVK